MNKLARKGYIVRMHRDAYLFFAFAMYFFCYGIAIFEYCSIFLKIIRLLLSYE